MSQNHHPLHDWELLKPIFEKIEQYTFEQYALSLEGIERAFELNDYHIRCIDEGTPGGIHIAGSGILMEETKAIEVIRRTNARGIYSHAGCGAAGLYAKAKGLDPAQADEYGKIWAKRLAEISGIPYLGHIEMTEMKRPEHYHYARVTYYDGTGTFEPSNVEGLPAGFVISRKHLEPDYALQEAQVSINIATGDHGYGALITSDEPFYIIAIGDREGISSQDLVRELEQLINASNGRVKIYTFDKPSKQ